MNLIRNPKSGRPDLLYGVLGHQKIMYIISASYWPTVIKFVPQVHLTWVSQLKSHPRFDLFSGITWVNVKIKFQAMAAHIRNHCIQTYNLACTDLLMNPYRTQKLSQSDLLHMSVGLSPAETKWVWIGILKPAERHSSQDACQASLWAVIACLLLGY